MKLWMKRSISIVTAIAVVAGSVYLFDSHNLQHADAKETLQSITKVVSAVTDTAPYTIVELVPDVATKNDVALKDYKDVEKKINITQSMGTVGYYIGGQEPNVKDAAQKFVEYGLNDTALRKSYIETVTKRLIDAGIITTDEANTSTPIYSSGYQELVKGDISLTDDEKAKMDKGTYPVIPFDDRDPADPTKSIPHKDHLYGYMKQDASGTGHFLYQYVPSPVENPPVPDYAVEFLKGNSTSNFSKEYGQGQFEPHFTTADGVAVEFAAKFEKIDACKRGYLVEQASVDNRWDATSNQGTAGQPVYKKDDNGIYIYVGKVKEDAGSFTIDYADPADQPTEVYLAKFVYTDAAGDGAILYQIKEYDYLTSGVGTSTGLIAQYALDTAAPLASNMCGTGIVKVADAGSWNGMTESNLFYKYLPDGGGNYTFNSRPDDSSLRQYYYVEGAEIHFFSGYHNREWFKQYSLDRDPDQCAALNVVVHTIPVLNSDDSILTNAEIDAAKLFVLSNPNTNYVLEGSSYVRYGLKSAADVVHDIKGAQLLRILGRVVQASIPIISDYSIITDADNASGDDKTKMQAALMYRFAKILTLQDLSAYYSGRENLTEEQLRADAADPEKSGTLMDANEHHFVNKNVYVYHMKAPASSNPQLVSFLNVYYEKEHFKEDVVTNAFSEVLLDIENENLYRETDGGKPKLATDISQAVSIRYIIGYAQKRAYNTKGTMRILELEPCASYDLQVDKVDDKHDALKLKTTSPFTTLIDQPETKIELTQMTTAEFIGKVEDLNSLYDLVYIGMNIDKLNTVTTNKVKTTVYNDTTMNGLVYSNVGDYVYGQPVLAGLLDKDYVNGGKSGDLKGRNQVSINDTLSRYRYSGNDITKEKLEDLMEYVKAGYPIVLANQFITTTKTNGNTIINVNTDRVDSSSYLYEFLNTKSDNENKVRVIDMKNVFKLENMSSALFNWYLNLAKPSIVLQDPTSAAQTQVKEVAVDTGNGMYYPKFNFKLENKGAADSASTYDCRLYIDINADGKFSETTERLSNFKVRKADGSEVYKDGDRYQLKAGTDEIYYGSCELSEAYTGVLPWEIVVRQNGNDNRRMVAKGYYEIKNDKENIKILQIDSDSDRTWDMEKTSKNPGIFKTLLEDGSVRFNVDIKTITSSQFSAGDFDGDGVQDDPTAALDAKTYKKCLDRYDMLVLGFADCYKEANSTATEAIKEYIAEGRSVLFTHDTSSFVNAPASQYRVDGQDLYNRWTNEYGWITYWGYEFNKQIRNLVGMDRYGVMGSSDQKEKAYKPKSVRNEKLDEIQGFTYPVINLYRYKDNDRYGQAFPTKVNLVGIDTGSGQNDQVKTVVSQVNSGQLTTYPYALPSSFEAAPTHGQYYQLDLAADDDKDGESDIVVWYCIQNSTGKTNDLFSMSPNDVRNNYYIYNKGNITYSGVGHSAVMKEVNGSYVANGSDAEIKLFINTLIAAYQSGLHAPKVKILENYKATSREIGNIYVSYDSQLTAMENGGVLDTTEDMYFCANSVSLLQSTANTTQEMQAKLYYEDVNGAEEIEIDGKKIKLTELGLGGLGLWYYDTVNNAEVAGDPNNIISGNVYKLKIPTTLLKSNMNKAQLYLVVTQTLTNTTTKKVSKVSGNDTAALVRVQMFNLE